ncbi:MAG: TetR/AcrR family transcriptional regulator [Myxococcales bacterium]|nr:TetR/AcrR family transcriptional regulator [Myxococcales bacterium]
MTGKSKQLEWIQPQQARSRKRLELLLDAGEALMGEKGLDQATVAEIAERAGSSVGAFYTRFPDKDALFYSVLQRFYEQLTATVQEATAPARWADVPADKMVDHMLAFALHMVDQQRHVIASMIARAPRDARVRAYLLRARDLIIERCIALLKARQDLAATPDVEPRCRALMWLLLAAFPMAAIFGGDAVSDVEPEEVVRQLRALVLRQLGIDAQSPSPERRALN